MRKAKASTKLLPFDAARYLTDDAAVAEYMTAVLEGFLDSGVRDCVKTLRVDVIVVARGTLS
jgi:DNA-binding phage protein